MKRGGDKIRGKGRENEGTELSLDVEERIKGGRGEVRKSRRDTRKREERSSSINHRVGGVKGVEKRGG